jgi:hypothetical protein
VFTVARLLAMFAALEAARMVPLIITPEAVAAFWAKIVRGTPDECWLWTHCRNRAGYGRVRFSGCTRLAHRVAYEITFDLVDPPHLFVLHRCDNPPCVNPSHLFVGTHHDNMRDMRAKGRSLVGERQPASRLTTADVQDIRQRRAAGQTLEAIGLLYGVSLSNVHFICTRKHWRHLA